MTVTTNESGAPEPQLLRQRDLAALWGVKPRTVEQIVRRYRPGGRYPQHPLPAPVYLVPASAKRGPQMPVWLPKEGETLDELRQRLLVWFRSRPGRGRRAVA